MTGWLLAALGESHSLGSMVDVTGAGSIECFRRFGHAVLVAPHQQALVKILVTTITRPNMAGAVDAPIPCLSTFRSQRRRATDQRR